MYINPKHVDLAVASSVRNTVTNQVGSGALLGSDMVKLESTLDVSNVAIQAVNMTANNLSTLAAVRDFTTNI